MKLHFLAFFSFILINHFCFAQNKPVSIYKRINQTAQVFPNVNEDSKETPLRKEFKHLLEEIDKTEKQSLAVSYARIGKIYTDHQYYNEADKHLKKALKYRKDIGAYLPIRWVLMSLYKNSLAAKDFNKAIKYSQEWIKYLDVHLEDTTWRSVYGSFFWNWNTPEDVYIDDISIRIKEISNTYASWNKEKLPDEEAEKRYHLGEKMLKKYLKNLDDTYPILFVKKGDGYNPFYASILGDFLGQNNTEQLFYWEKRSLKTIKKYGSKQQFADYLRYLAVLYRDRKNQELELAAIKKMKDYAALNKELKNYSQITFAHRYIGLRYLHIEFKMESFYAFTNAIKHCNQYNLTQEKSKSYYGIDQILGSLAEKHDSKTLDSLKNWKANYSLEKLSTEDIKTIDKQLNDFDFDKYLSVEKDKRGNKKAEGKIENGKKEGRWVWYSYFGNNKEKEVNYKNGLKEGKEITYSYNGKIKSLCEYIAGKREGTYKEFYNDGKLKKTCNFKDDKKQGISKEFFENGNLFQEYNFVNDTLQGDFKEYFADGSLKLEAEYVNGIVEGKVHTYYDSGSKYQIFNIKNGKPDGEQLIFYVSGAIQATLHMMEGIKDGKQEFYSLDGKLVKTETWENDKLITKEEY